MKCPLCESQLDVYDIDCRFRGNETRYADCENCHHSFIFEIRYGHIWKYTKTKLIYDENIKSWVCDEKTEETVIVWKG